MFFLCMFFLLVLQGQDLELNCNEGDILDTVGGQCAVWAT